MSKKTFKNLDDSDMEYIKMMYYDTHLSHKEKMEIMGGKFGVTGRTIRGWWQKLDLSNAPNRLPSNLQDARFRNLNEDTDIVLVTSAQNTTSINLPLLNNLKTYRDYLINEFNYKVEIIIIPLRYRNPTSPLETDKKRSDLWWYDDLNDYLFYNKIQFGDSLISADTHVTPTATNPLSGFESLAGDSHLILGHPRIHFKPQPRFRGEELKTMATTGCITRKNYSMSKAGDKAHIHHSYGFMVIEKNEDNTCNIPRNVFAKEDGSFIDLKYSVNDNEVKIIDSCSSLIWGDIHEEQIDINIYDRTVELSNIITPKQHILHDVLDGYRFNPHERNDMYVLKKKIRDGRYLIKDEIDRAVNFPSKLINDCGGDKVYVVESNHDVFLDRHINDYNWKKDLHNSTAYLKYAMIQQEVELEDYGNIFGYLIHENGDNRVTYLKYGEILKDFGFNLAMHGDFGTNGSRGNITQFKRLNTKMIHGHNHTPIIMDGVTSVGMTAKIKKYYTRKGMSTHSNAHCVVHNNGKRQLLVFNDEGIISNLI